MGYEQWVGIIAGAFTSTAMLPQIIKTFREKKAENISLVMILVLLTGISGWIYYGFLRDDLPIIITNGISLILNVILLILHWQYEDKK